MPSTKVISTDAFVADASVGIAWTVESQATPATEHLLDCIQNGAPFVVPFLWSFEAANALLVLVRRKRILSEDFPRACAALSGLTPLVDDRGPDLAWKQVSNLAERFELTIYDATYLEVAIRRGLALASRDKALNGAARLCGVKTLV